MEKRGRDEQGRQIVQVRFYGQTSSRGYSYLVDPAVGELAYKDLVWTPGNQINPYGSPAVVVATGSEYTGAMEVITQRLERGYDPQTITVKKYMSPARRRALDDLARQEGLGDQE